MELTAPEASRISQPALLVQGSSPIAHTIASMLAETLPDDRPRRRPSHAAARPGDCRRYHRHLHHKAPHPGECLGHLLLAGLAIIAVPNGFASRWLLAAGISLDALTEPVIQAVLVRASGPAHQPLLAAGRRARSWVFYGGLVRCRWWLRRPHRWPRVRSCSRGRRLSGRAAGADSDGGAGLRALGSSLRRGGAVPVGC
jgi:hypothetical protein